MQYVDERYHLRVDITSRNGSVPEDQLTRMQRSLEPLGQVVAEYPDPELRFTVIHHAASGKHHVEGRLRLPGRTLFAADRDDYLDTAFQRRVGKLTRLAGAYQPPAAGAAHDRTTLDRDIVAPEDSAAGPLGAAVQAGDFRRFRTLLGGYEEWLRKRVGRWVPRYPALEARLNRDLGIADLVDEVYLNAFEQFTARPTDVRLSDWLDGLLDPSLKTLQAHPAEEKENINMARTLLETQLPRS